MADKSLKKRNLILDCAEKVFSQKGFSVVTMKDIIEACNISRGGIYLYFSSTDEIFMEVIKSHHQTYLKKTQHNIDEVKDFQVIVETYFENLKQEMLNIKGSLKLAMVEFFITHKTDTESEFFISAMNGLKAPISEILLLGKKQGKISYDNLSDAADLVFYWQIGLEEIMLSTNVPIESLYLQIDLMKKLIFTGCLEGVVEK